MPCSRPSSGVDVDDVFAEFEWDAVGGGIDRADPPARAALRRTVVVKVQRPGIEQSMERDLAALALIANVAQRRTEFGHGVRSGEMLDQFADGLRAELDFRKEADAMDEMAPVLAGSSAVRVPTVHKELCTRRLLVQEQFDGFTVADTGQLEASGMDRTALAMSCSARRSTRCCGSASSTPIPTPGTSSCLSDGSLGLIDFGAVGRLDSIQQAAMVDIMLAIAAARRQPAARRDRAGHRPVRRGVTRAARASVGAADGRSRASDRGRGAGRAAGPRRGALPVRLQPADGSRRSSRARSSPWTARSGRSRPTSLVTAATEMMESKDSAGPRPQAMVRDELLA